MSGLRNGCNLLSWMTSPVSKINSPDTTRYTLCVGSPANNITMPYLHVSIDPLWGILLTFNEENVSLSEVAPNHAAGCEDELLRGDTIGKAGLSHEVDRLARSGPLHRPTHQGKRTAYGLARRGVVNCRTLPQFLSPRDNQAMAAWEERVYPSACF